ncbi:hypothetical protein Cni_G21932 [Canna indica]|uniref:Uncharacterized protein n=1 Tax=Canna indica TaxID=4628 RepID=A0AAQ3KU68_9LILI|nr:hypothetical protein Cni_G21932 [Canna indica]
MEFISKTRFFFFFLAVSSLFFTTSQAGDTTPAVAVASGTIQREIKQQILASVSPNSPDNTVPFLTSPSGKYTGYLLRRETSPGAGGMGNDFCYVQIQDTESGAAVWESECEPVSSANACSLVLCDLGLAMFDGSNDVWDTGADNGNNFPASLELVDLGDMRVIDKDGELVWRASDDPRVNQRCGLPGSPGFPSDAPPFVTPIGGGSNPPFGQQNAGYTGTGALPVATPPVAAPVGGEDNLSTDPSNGVLPVPAASPPVAAPVGGEDNLPSNPSNGAATPAGGGNSLPSDLPTPVAPPPVLGPSGVGDETAAPLYPSNGAFGQQQQLQGLNGGHQPLVDNNPYDSGSSRMESWTGVVFMVVVGQLVVYGL